MAKETIPQLMTDIELTIMLEYAAIPVTPVDPMVVFRALDRVRQGWRSRYRNGVGISPLSRWCIRRGL